MNYWPRWVNAIKKRTATLSLMEMGAYDRLLDHYYAEEQPLPSDLDECCRIAAALTKDERKAVEKVLAKFFTLEAAGFRNERADEEILLALPKIAAAKANGSKGGRPKGSQNKPGGFPVGNPAATQEEPTPKAPHPHSSSSLRSELPPASPVPPADAGNRKPRASRKCPESFALTEDLREFARSEAPKANVEREFAKFLDHTFKTSHSDWPATFRNWLRNASDRSPATVSFLAEKQAEAAKWLKGTSLDRSHTDTEFFDGAQLKIR